MRMKERESGERKKRMKERGGHIQGGMKVGGHQDEAERH